MPITSTHKFAVEQPNGEPTIHRAELLFGGKRVEVSSSSEAGLEAEIAATAERLKDVY